MNYMFDLQIVCIFIGCIIYHTFFNGQSLA